MSNGDIFYRKGYGSLWMYENGCLVRINDGITAEFYNQPEFIFIGHIAWYVLEGEMILDGQQTD